MNNNKIDLNERYMLKGALRRNGFDHWRFVTSGVSRTTGEERTFFIEFFIINPLLSPDECVLGFKSRFGKTAADLQYALAGTESAKSANNETLVQPSFVMVKAGQYSMNGKQINGYFPFSILEIGKNDFILRIGNDPRTACVLGNDYTQGVVQVTKSMLAEQPELLCQSGTMGWNLKFEKQIPFKKFYSGKKNNWVVLGGRTNVTGTIVFDSEEFAINSDRSFGYFDKEWGRDFSSPFIHLNSCNFISLISGKQLQNSCFAVQGVFDESLSVMASIEGEDIEFFAGKDKKYVISYDCTEMPEDEEGVKLHWTVSISNKKKVLDIDIFCNTNIMFLRDYESPEGGRKVLKILGGGNGHGEIRLYHKVKKNLELIEHARIENCVCEYGNMEYPEK